MDWYKRYPARWTSKCRGLDPYQEGCYLRLCDEYIATGKPLPDDDAELADICRIPLKDWLEKAAPALRRTKFFRMENGKLIQNTCEEIVEERRAISQAKSKAASVKWKKPENPEKSKDDDAHAMHVQCREKEREIDRKDTESRIQNPKSPPTPPCKIQPKDSGFENSGFGDSGFRPGEKLSSAAIATGKKFAPRWDIQQVIGMWESFVSKQNSPPNNNDASFIAWVKRNIKGMPPP